VKRKRHDNAAPNADACPITLSPRDQDCTEIVSRLPDRFTGGDFSPAFYRRVARLKKAVNVLQDHSLLPFSFPVTVAGPPRIFTAFRFLRT
jgi:hypothetical protein